MKTVPALCDCASVSDRIRTPEPENHLTLDGIPRLREDVILNLPFSGSAITRCAYSLHSSPLPSLSHDASGLWPLDALVLGTQVSVLSASFRSLATT